jgi:excisionase family DNA binding protein
MKPHTHESNDVSSLPRLLTPRQVADLIGVSERKVRRLAHEGMLEHIRIGHRTSRYTARSVRAFIDPLPDEQRLGDHPGIEHTSGGDARNATSE